LQFKSVECKNAEYFILISYLVMLSPRLHGVDGRWKWLWGIGGMGVTGENQNTWRKYLIVSLL